MKATPLQEYDLTPFQRLCTHTIAPKELAKSLSELHVQYLILSLATEMKEENFAHENALTHSNCLAVLIECLESLEVKPDKD